MGVRRTALLAATGFIVVVIAMVLWTTGAFGHNNRSYNYVPPTIPAGLSLHQHADALEKRVLDDLGANSKIESVRVVTNRAAARAAIPSLPKPARSEAKQDGPAWIVRAFGMFEPVTAPPGAALITQPHHGFVVVDDKTGATIAYGWGK